VLDERVSFDACGAIARLKAKRIDSRHFFGLCTSNPSCGKEDRLRMSIAPTPSGSPVEAFTCQAALG